VITTVYVTTYLYLVNWLNVETVNLTADSLWNAFSNVLQTAIDVYVPTKSAINCANTKCRRWYPAALRRAISRKCCLWRKKRDDPSNTNIAASYTAAERKCKKLLRNYEIKKEQQIIERNIAGSFYRFVDSKLSCKRDLGALSKSTGDVIVGDAERADLFNSYFSSVCTTDNGTIPVLDRSVPEDVNLDFVEFTSGKVHSAIKKLKANAIC